MNAVIKADSAGTVRSYGPSVAPPPGARPPSAAPEKTAEEKRQDALERENASLKGDLEEMTARASRIEEQAREEGRREGLQLARQDDERRIEAVVAGIKRALTALDDRLTELDALAVLVSKSALAKVFDASFDKADMVVAAVGRQMQHLRREAILSIQVSSADFPDKDSLDVLKEKSDNGSIRIEVADLDRGSCKIELQFGHVDAGPDSQWHHLQALLDELSNEDIRG